MSADMTPLLRGLERTRDKALDGARDGLKSPAAALRDEMRANHPHGNITGGTEAGYGARVVGRGETGSAEFASEVARAEALNPGSTETGTVTIGGLGVIIDSKARHQKYLEQNNAGANAVLGPAIASNGSRLTQGAAQGSKKALGG